MSAILECVSALLANFASVILPSAGVVFIVSNVGSAPLFARKNLPSLLDVPCTNLSKPIVASAILSESTAPLTIILLILIIPS